MSWDTGQITNILGSWKSRVWKCLNGFRTSEHKALDTPPSLFRFSLTCRPWYLPPVPGNHQNAKRCKRDPIGVGQSATLDKLLELVGKGDAHVQTMADVARAVSLDFPNSIHSGLQKLAGCGANGNQDGNTERDFQRLVRGSNGFFLEPYNIKLTLQVWQTS